MSSVRESITSVSRSLLAAATATILVFTLSACGSDGPDTAGAAPAVVEAGTSEITIANFSFSNPVSISPGSTVTVTNADGVDHTWTSEDGLFDSGLLAPGSSFEFTFDQAGEFRFICEIHPSMTGAVAVEA